MVWTRCFKRNKTSVFEPSIPNPMKTPQGPPRERPELQQNERIQRQEVVMMLTCDDMAVRLQQLAREGRQQDCLALMQELEDWQSFGRGDVAPVLHVSYIGDR